MTTSMGRTTTSPRAAALTMLLLAALAPGCSDKKSTDDAVEKAKAEARDDLLGSGKKTDDLFSKVDTMAQEAGKNEDSALGAVESVSESESKAVEEKEAAEKRQREAAAKAPRLAFARGQRFRVHWSWGGDVGGDLLLTILESQGGAIRASLTLPDDPASAKTLEGKDLQDGSVWPVRLKSKAGTGVPREAGRNPFALSPSLRWLYQDADYEIRIHEREGMWTGMSGQDIEWKFKSMS